MLQVINTGTAPNDGTGDPYNVAGRKMNEMFSELYAVPPGSDSWTHVKLTQDFTTSSGSAVNVTGLAFTPAANTNYEFYVRLLVRTATATVGPRPGLAWPTGLTDGVAYMDTTSAAATRVMQNGNITAALLGPVGGLPTTTGSWPAWIQGWFIGGPTPSGAVQVQLASETAGTNVTIKAGSCLSFRVKP